MTHTPTHKASTGQRYSYGDYSRWLNASQAQTKAYEPFTQTPRSQRNAYAPVDR